MSKRIIFQTGHGKGLAKAEIESLFPGCILDEVQDGFICHFETIKAKLTELNKWEEAPQSTLNRMGGIVRILEVLKDGPAHMPLNFEQWLVEVIKEEKTIQEKSGKFRFGLSMHPKSDKVLKGALIGSKKEIKKSGHSIRFINKDFQNLSSVQAWHEGMLKENAAEYHLFRSSKLSSEEGANEGRWYLGKTLAIQNFEWYSKRDYERPAKNAKNGMFPPKLAQILINLATEGIMTTGENDSEIFGIYDPFCGSGTVLQEAWIMGYKAYGSDLAPKMVEDTQINLDWLIDLEKKRAQKHGATINETSPEVFHANATALKVDQLPSTPFAIITETWLGPVLKQCPTPLELPKIQREIETIYEDFFSNLKELWEKRESKAPLSVVFTAPYHRDSQNRHFLPNLPEILQKYGKIIPLSDHERPSMFYERKNQVVSREIWKVEIE